MGIDELRGRHVHFIGIGGISMSGLAQILIGRGCAVSGSDQSDNPLLHRLRALGAVIYIGHRAGQQAGADLVVVNSAIAADNPERRAAEEEGIPIIGRAELLGSLMAEYRCAVGISGTHGKTTTTSMLSTLLVLGGKDPTLHIGGVLPLIDGAVRAGGHDYFVTEACEYCDNFLSLYPRIAVLLNIDQDHLDYFKDIDHIARSFAAFAARVPEDGLVVGNGDDARVAAILRSCGRPFTTFGLGEGNDWQARDITVGADGCCSFTLWHEKAVGPVTLGVPGRHNVMNALAALATADACGVSGPGTLPYLTGYRGALRRFERIGSRNGAAVIHDYAHHPTEIRATLATARAMNPRRLWCVFQPHTYTRTRALFREFTGCFAEADEVVLLPIYAAREEDPGDISSAMLAQAIAWQGDRPRCRYCDSFEQAQALVGAQAGSGDIVLVLGAGTVEALAWALAGE